MELQQDSTNFVSVITSYSIHYTKLYDSDFTKFRIMQDLEEILDKGLYKEDSQLGKKPTQTIKKITSDYNKLREQSLREIQKLQKR